MSKTISDSLITFNAAAQCLAVTKVELCSLIARGSMPRPVKVAGGLKFFTSDIEVFLHLVRSRRHQKTLVLP